MAEVSIDLNMVRVTNEDFVKKVCTGTAEDSSSSGFYCRYCKNRKSISGCKQKR